MPLITLAASAVIVASGGASLPASVGAALTQTEAPSFQVGEEWEFAYENDLDRAQSSRYTQRVERVGPDGVTLAPPSGNATRRTLLDANVNVVQSPAGRFTPSSEALRFPLFVGKSWRADYTYTSGGWTSRCERNAQVTAVERVTTSAGTFDACRIDSTTTWAGTSIGADAGRSRMTDWYAPAVGRFIKGTYEGLPDNKSAPRTSSSYEVVRFKPGMAP